MSKSSDSAPPTFFYLGKETNTKQNNNLIYIFDDGIVEKRIVIE